MPGDPSQHVALGELTAFSASLLRGEPGGRRLFRWRRSKAAKPGRGLYLDGGFGVGKTHLLASVFHAADGVPRAFLSFQELVHRVGLQGLDHAAAGLAGLRLLCLDEFELDDPGNTLIIKRVLEALFAGGTAVVTTSNTPASAQGAGRFNAEDFRREIQGIADRFRTLRLDGPDYRAAGRADGRSRLPVQLPGPPAGARQPVITTDWNEFMGVLGRLHPIRYRPLLGKIGTLRISGAQVLRTQGDALRFVHFIDRLYDLEAGLQMSAAGAVAEEGLEALFAPSYRHGAYAQKHDRCLSRLGELLSPQLLPARAPVLS